MSAQKKSLIGSRPAVKKVAAQRAKSTQAIGEPKPLTASALQRSVFGVRTLKAERLKPATRLL